MKSHERKWVRWSLLIAAMILFFLAAGYVFTEASNYVIEPKVLARFRYLAQTEDVAIERSSNNHFLFGHPHRVDYEVMVKDKTHKGGCDLAAFSVLNCWLEEGENGRLN